MSAWRAALAGAGLLVSACAVDPVNMPTSALATLDRELAAIAGDPKRPLASLSVLAIRDGKVAYEGHFGGIEKPVGPRTVYRVASISKLVTTIGVLRLVDEGRLALDRDVATYLGYPVRNPRFPDEAVTLRMLLTHTSSIRDDAGYVGVSVKDVLQKAAAWSDERPAAYFRYSNLAWRLVGEVMEGATGERFDHLMRRLVIDPLGMTGGYNPAELPRSTIVNLATLYRKASAGDVQVWNPDGPWVPQTDDYTRAAPPSAYGPQGSLRASAADLGQVMLMLMNGGELDGRRILKAETVATMLSVQWRHDSGNGETTFGGPGRFNAWGLGNQRFLDVTGPGYGDRLVEGGGFVACGHIGAAYGLLGLLAFDPVAKNGIIYLTGGTGFDPRPIVAPIRVLSDSRSASPRRCTAAPFSAAPTRLRRPQVPAA